MNAAADAISLYRRGLVDEARKLASRLGSDYVLSLHDYNDADGNPIFHRIRLKHPNGDKVIRPIRFEAGRWQFGEPKPPAEGKPLYGLDRLAKTKGGVVYVVEGETSCEALWDLGLLATTSGSASSAGAADWSPLAGRRVILWPDNDEPGCAYAASVGAKLRCVGCAVEVIDAAELDLSEGGDAVDWLASHADATAETVAQLRKLTLQNSENSRNSSAPEPLRRKVASAAVYPVASLGPILGPACESLRRVIQAPTAVCGGSLLAAASLATQGLADIDNDGRIHPLSLWMLTIAESGERKSGVDKVVMRPVREFERALAAEFATTKEQYDTEIEEWNLRRDAARKKVLKGDGGGLAVSLREIGAAPPEPLRPSVLVADFTSEGLAKLMLAGRPSLGAFTDEGGLVLGGHAMSRETVVRTAATLSKLWDCGELDRIRAGDGPVKMWGKRLAMHLLAQPVVAERALADAVLSGQGFLPRCLIAWPEGTAGTRLYSSERLDNDAAVIRYTGRISQLLHTELPLAVGQRNELSPRHLRLSNTAAQTWQAMHDAIERAMHPEGSYSMVKSWASKTPEQCLRIAGVLALVEDPAANEITADLVDRASDLAVWHLNEAARLAGTAAVSDDIRHAEAILRWCHATHRQITYSTDAMQFGPNVIRDADVFKAAMRALERTGWATKLTGGAIIDGRHRKHVWNVLPEED